MQLDHAVWGFNDPNLGPGPVEVVAAADIGR